ncbi:MAG: GNAT family N-acetyltransferase [Chloroflexi bacterium]|nr:GNAT family N-acetyltransferase [Chloroflexota bacterium]
MGKLVRLRAVEIADWEFYYQLNQMTTDLDRRDYEIVFPQSKEAIRAWAEEQSKAKGDRDEFRFQIEALSSGASVGSLNTHTADHRVGSFMYGLSIAPDHQRKGYGSEAIRLVMRYFFQEKRYQKVSAEVYSFNEPSIRLHDHLGFTLEGRLRRMVYTGGQFYDALIYGMLREEFEQRWPNAGIE